MLAGEQSNILSTSVGEGDLPLRGAGYEPCDTSCREPGEPNDLYTQTPDSGDRRTSRLDARKSKEKLETGYMVSDQK